MQLSVPPIAAVGGVLVLGERFSSRLPRPVRGVTLSPDGRLLAAAIGAIGDAGGGGVKVWDWRAGREVFSHEQKDGVGGVCFSPDGKRLAAHLGEAVQVWDVATGAAAVRCKPGVPLAAGVVLASVSVIALLAPAWRASTTDLAALLRDE